MGQLLYSSCQILPFFQSPKVSKLIINYVIACDCNTEGSKSITCTEQGGKCFCKDTVGGDKCDVCKAEHFGFPTCERMYYEKEIYKEYFFLENTILCFRL